MLRSNSLAARAPCSLLAALVLALACSLGGCAARPAAQPRIVLIGWDGADWEAVRSLVDRGRLPHLAKLIEQGSSGRLHTFEPMLSPLIWTSIATGREPPDHGVLDFLSVDESTGTIAPVTSHQRRTKALWNLLGEHGLRSAFVGWLVTFPAETVSGRIVSERVSILSFARNEGIEASGPEGKTYPPELFDEIEELVVQPGEIPDPAVRERFALEALPGEERLAQLRGTLAQTESYRRIALALLGRRDVDLFAVYFEAIDAISHLFSRYAPPLMPGTRPEDMRRYGHLIEDTYVQLDEILGEIVAGLPESTTVYVVSDHGFKLGDERILFEESSMKDAYAADWHRDNGILVVRGPGVRRGEVLDDADVFDLTPTLLAQLGIPAGRDMPGRALVEIWEPEAAPTVPEPVDTHESEGWKTYAVPSDSAADDEKLKQRLEALGYVGAGRAAVHSNEASNLAAYLAHRGELPRALDAVRAALAANPRNANAWKTLGVIEIRRRNYAAAIEALTQVTGLRNDPIEVYVTLAGLLEQVGEHARAIGLLEPLAERHPDDPRIPARLGTLHARGGDYDEAIRQYQRSLSRFPHQGRVRYELLAARAMSGQGDEVLRALEHEPPDAGFDVPLEVGKVFFRLGDPVRAASAFELSARRDATSPDPHFYRGLLELRRQDPQAALESFERALRLDPDATEVRLNRGLAYIRLGRTDEAIAVLRAILAAEPGYAPAHTYLGEAYLAAGRIDEARAEVDRALELDPRAKQAAALRARIPDG